MGFPPPRPARPRESGYQSPYGHKREFGYLEPVSRLPWFNDPEALAFYVHIGVLTVDEAKGAATSQSVINRLELILYGGSETWTPPVCWYDNQGNRYVPPDIPPVPYLTYTGIMIDEGYDESKP